MSPGTPSTCCAPSPATLARCRRTWNANIYYPHPLALAYSEHLTAQALLVLPVYAATKNPILCYNVLFLLTFFLSAVGMFLFVRALTGSAAGAFLAGIAFGFAPYRFGTMPHVQVLSSMWMPLALFGFHRFLESRRTLPLAGGAAAWAAQNLSCGYYVLYFSPVMALYLAIEITRRHLWSDRALLARAAAAVTAVGAATLPFLLPYWHLRQLGFSPRSLAETRRFAADTLSYLTTESGLRLWGRIVRAWPQPEGYLFPGFTIVMLAALASVQLWRQAGWSSAGRARFAAPVLTVLLTLACGISLAILFGWSLRVTVAGIDFRLTSLGRGVLVAAALALALVAISQRARSAARLWFASPVSTLCIVTLFAFAMSLGPDIHARARPVEDWNIYALFYDHVPGFDGLRVPARYAMIVALGLAGLAGIGGGGIARRRHGPLMVAVAAALMTAEAWASPIPINVTSAEYTQSGLAPLPDHLPARAEMPPVYRFVATLPPSSALIELPFGEVAFEIRYMYFSTLHWRPLVNGYSGGAPDLYGLWAEQLRDLSRQPGQAWQAVIDSHATHLIVHEGSYLGEAGPRTSAWAVAHGAREVAAFGSDRIFEVR